ncbi:MAG: hypothetical protein ACK4ZW_14045, partial [Blastomonas sp.]
SGAPQRTLRGSVQHMQILYVDPGKLLRMSGALGPLQGEAMAGTMTIALAAIKGGTRLTFDYVAGGFMRMPQDAMASAVDGVIGAQASRLAMALGPLVGGGKNAAPSARDDAGEGKDTGSASVGSLVADLAPDDDVPTAGGSKAPATEPAKPAASPARTRPVARPVREPAEDESGR